MNSQSIQPSEAKIPLAEDKTTLEPLYEFKMVDELPELSIDPASKERFARGVGGDSLGEAQGYICFVNLKNGKLYLVPARNSISDMPILDKNGQPFEMYVQTNAQLGGSTGSLHPDAAEALGLTEDFEDGYLLGFGIFKGKSTLLYQFRNKSLNCNGYAIVYAPEYQEKFLKEDSLEAPHGMTMADFLKRCLPKDISEKIMAVLKRDLPLDSPDVKREIQSFECRNFKWEKEWGDEIREKMKERSLEDQIYRAIKRNNLNKLNQLDEKLKNLNAEEVNKLFKLENLSRESALFLLAKKNKNDKHPEQNAAVLKWLIKHNCNLNDRDWLNDTALHVCARHGDEQVAQLLIDEKIDVNLKNNHGRTALIFAAEEGHLHIVEKLLAAKADPSIQNEAKKNALMYAAANGHVEIVKLLINNDFTNVNEVDVCNHTALNLAASAGHIDVVRALLSKADPNIPDDDYCTPLLSAAEHGHAEIVKLLIDNHVDKQTIDRTGNTALILAAKNGHAKAVKELLDAQIDPTIENYLRENALRYAAENGHLEVVRLLIAKMSIADVNKRYTNTALNKAARMGHVEIVRTLLEAKADPKINFGISTILASAEYGHFNVVELLMDSITEEDKNPFLTAAICKQNYVFVEKLLAMGADPNTKGRYPIGYPYIKALERACSFENFNISIIGKLLEYGATTEDKPTQNIVNAYHFHKILSHCLQNALRFYREKNLQPIIEKLINEMQKEFNLLKRPEDLLQFQNSYKKQGEPLTVRNILIRKYPDLLKSFDEENARLILINIKNRLLNTKWSISFWERSASINVGDDKHAAMIKVPRHVKEQLDLITMALKTKYYVDGLKKVQEIANKTPAYTSKINHMIYEDQHLQQPQNDYRGILDF